MPTPVIPGNLNLSGIRPPWPKTQWMWQPTKCPDGSLSARNMPKPTSKPDKNWLVEVNKKTPDGKLVYTSDGKIQKKHVQMEGAKFADGSLQSLYSEDDHIILPLQVSSKAWLSSFRNVDYMKTQSWNTSAQNFSAHWFHLTMLWTVANTVFSSTKRIFLRSSLFLRLQQNPVVFNWYLFQNFTVKLISWSRIGDMPSGYTDIIHHLARNVILRRTQSWCWNLSLWSQW